MKWLQVTKENEQYFTKEFILGFNTGAKAQSEAGVNLVRFAEWVADWILRSDFQESAGGFAELACRRLEELGIMRKEGNLWVRNEAEENE